MKVVAEWLGVSRSNLHARLAGARSRVGATIKRKTRQSYRLSLRWWQRARLMAIAALP